MSDNFVLVLNDVSGLSAEYLEENGIIEIPSHVFLDGKELPQNSLIDEYYSLVYPDEVMFNKGIGTSCASFGEVKTVLASLLKDEKDVFYLHMSKSISSGTFEFAESVAEELRLEYPERKIVVLDAHTMSWGMGLLVKEFIESGKKTIKEAKTWLLENRDSIAHIFTVSNLEQFAKTGRCNLMKARVGTALKCQPYMEFVYDDEGEKKLTALETISHKKCLKKIASETVSRLDWETDPRVYVTYGAKLAFPDAEFIAKQIQAISSEQGIPTEIIYERVVPMIGNHTGPSVISIHFREKN